MKFIKRNIIYTEKCASNNHVALININEIKQKVKKEGMICQKSDILATR